MDKSVLLQKQIKDNAEDLHSYVRDLKLWEAEMKRKDRQLSNEPAEEALPPVRRPKLATKTHGKTEEKKESTPKKKLTSYDYSSWDKFEVEKACEEIDNEDSKDEDDQENSEELAAQEEKYLKEKALYEKELGNKHVKANKWEEAIESYTRAIEAYPKDPVFFANRALCYLKKKKYEMVESDCTASLKLDPTYVKAMLRRAAARESLGRVEDARYDLRNALKLEPNNSQALRDLERLKDVSNLKKSTPASGKETGSITSKESPSQNVTSIQGKPTILPSQSSSGNKLGIKKDSSLVKSSEPEWEPCSNTIEPIVKPPHMRSKKSLKQIKIYDVGPNSPKHVCTRKTQKSQNPPTLQNEEPQATTSSKEVPTASKEEVPTTSRQEVPMKSKQEVPTTSRQEVPTTIKEEVPVPPLGTAKSRSIFTVSTPAEDIPPPPTTSVQFHTSWNSIKTNPHLRYRFLKQIPGEHLPEIFKESLESTMFSSILETLASEFTTKDEPVLSYLRGLTQVKRFSTLAMFMSSADKSNLTKLFDHCLKKGECPSGDVSALRRLYEMS